MKTFLRKIADELLDLHRDHLDQICVVLPSRRAGLYLKKHLGQAAGTSIWSPAIYSIEDFIIRFSGYRQADNATLLLELYEIHQELKKEEKEDFDSFASWAPSVLSDFNETDLYMVDAERLFSYLNEARALNVWNLGEGQLTDFEKNYIEFYQSLFTYYEILRERLKEKKLAYQGMAYRHVAANISSISKDLPFHAVLFAGLNALTTAEEQILDHLVSYGKASVYWDSDQYYIKDKKQEAGNFLRRYFEKWPQKPVKWLDDDFRDVPKKINITGVPRSMGQAMLAGDILSELASDDREGERTAVVLADEKLLVPVLHYLPENIRAINVTMGYSMKLTPLYQLFRSWFMLQVNGEKFQQGKAIQSHVYYIRDIMRILMHPYLSFWDEPGSLSGLSGLNASLRLSKKTLLSADDIAGLLTGIDVTTRNTVGLLLEKWESETTGLQQMKLFLESLKERLIHLQASGIGDHRMEMEYTHQFMLVINRIQAQTMNRGPLGSLRSLQRLLFMLLDITRIPFYGEPLKGLQVMGLLETRTVDFENLIVLSVNEGILPAGRSQQSFIPFDIRKDFKLPTHHEKDAVFAYHFYRMIQRAKNVYLLYDTEADDLGGGEKSRFIAQISYELPRYNPKTSVKQNFLSAPLPRLGLFRTITVEKTSSILEKLSVKAEKGLSPTSLSTYINCPLQFYFHEIAGITESEELEETIEAKTLGQVIHHVLEQVYNPFINSYLDLTLLKAAKKDLEPLTVKAFDEFYKDGDIRSGKNHLIYRVAVHILRQFLDSEVSLVRSLQENAGTIRILALEKMMRSELRIINETGELRINLKGKADRIDLLSGQFRIIDYKTGFVDEGSLKLEGWEDVFRDSKYSKAFQLAMYLYLFSRTADTPGMSAISGNISMRSLSKGLMTVSFKGDEAMNQEVLDSFESSLGKLLDEIFDPKNPFRQTENADNCKYCAFRMICNRVGSF